MKKNLALMFFAVLVCAACSSENEEDLGITQPGTITREDRVISYQTEVSPIVSTNCAISGCHVGGTGLPNYTKDENFEADANQIKIEVTSGRMPIGRTLSFEERDIIVSWVNQGAELD
ncbi:hypothetical protein [Reichenbachiella versicolor]|uniref:hypothetical protein n=1 Tax=Reichenbachiella versicolor TaxID=1821036 RepID=UPI0013A583A0|nr:hypothetical protein [Reichenbachiella versicolor]